MPRGATEALHPYPVDSPFLATGSLDPVLPQEITQANWGLTRTNNKSCLNPYHMFDMWNFI